MKLFLIKIGKAWSVLRREGILHGSARVLSAFLSLFRRVGSGDVLFVTNGVGDSARYRCRHVTEELNLHGFRASVAVQDNPFLLSYTDKFSVFVFHRTLFTPRLAEFIDRIKTARKTIIFEADDLVYDPEYIRHMDAFASMNPLERKLYEHGVGGEILADPYVEVATTTTSFLAEKLREKGKRVFVIPNKLSEKDLSVVEKIRHSPFTIHHSVSLAYFSGSASHNKDFATITEPLLSILEKHPETELCVYGPLDLDARFAAFGDRVKKAPYTPREKHWENVAHAGINLAPLQIGNPFCEAKSELKFFEAGIVEVPTVAAATRTFREAIRDGEDGFVAATPEEWTEKLERLVTDPGLRKRMGERARETALKRYTTETSSDEYLQYLREKVG